MLIAQALGEYGGTASLAAFLVRSGSTVRGFITGISTEGWLTIAVVVFVVLFARSRASFK